MILLLRLSTELTLLLITVLLNSHFVSTIIGSVDSTGKQNGFTVFLQL